MTLRIRVGATALAIACFGALVGCGTPRVDPESAPSPPQQILPTPTANDFVTTIMRTRGLSTADLAIDLTTTVGNDTTRLTGSGPAGIRGGYGRLTWTPDGGEAFTEVSNYKGLYVQTGGPSGLWTHQPDRLATPTSRLADPFRGLGTAMDVTRRGPERLGDQATTRFTARIPADSDSMALMGLSGDQIASLGDSSRGQWVEVTVWVDGRGRIVRVDRSVDIPNAPDGPVSATTTTLLDDFSRTVDVEPPPTESVTEAPTSTSTST